MTSFGYRLFYALHIAAFAPVVVAQVPGGRTASTAAITKTARAVYAAVLVPAGLFGMLCVLSSDSSTEFSQTWISLDFIVWIAMDGATHAMILAGRRRADGALKQPDEQIVTPSPSPGTSCRAVRHPLRSAHGPQRRERLTHDGRSDHRLRGSRGLDCPDRGPRRHADPDRYLTAGRTEQP